jgi:hypothetical protein
LGFRSPFALCPLHSDDYALEKVITAINQADVSEQEKNEAKSLLRKLLGSKAAAKVLGAGAQSLVAKYIT